MSNPIEMIFSDDAILISLFQRFEDDEEELKDSVIKYCHGGVMEANRPTGLQATKGDIGDLDMVIFILLTLIGNEPN